MNLTEYMNSVIELLVKDVLKSTFNNIRESTFVVKYILTQKNAAKKRSGMEACGIHIPPFLIVSIATECNLFCKGCYARANKSCGERQNNDELTCAQLEKIFTEASKLGVSFILLAGGEPLLRCDVIESAARFTDIVFPVFTNGTLIDENYLDIFNKNRNLVPVLSIEGNRSQTEARRGQDTAALLDNAMDKMSERGIFYGASITVTTLNLDSVTSRDFIEAMRNKGCKLIFYVEYVPVEASTQNLALTDKERIILSARQEDLRNQYENIIFISFPGDEKEMGGCLAAGRGFFHINATGGAEPCPFSPFSDVNLKNSSILEALKSPLFQKIKIQGFLGEEHEGGCLLFAKENEVKNLL